jgi:hypothetical protein
MVTSFMVYYGGGLSSLFANLCSSFGGLIVFTIWNRISVMIAYAEPLAFSVWLGKTAEGKQTN